MGHSRAGLAAAVLVAAMGIAAQTAWAQPVNDNFPGATLTGSTMTANGTNVGATAQAGEPNPAGTSGSRSVWWSWTAPGSGPAMITTAGSGYDTTLGIYTGSVVTALALVAQNDDGPFDLTSQISFTAIGGVTYRIQVNGWGGEVGAITLNLTSTTTSSSVVWNSSPPPNALTGAGFSVSWTVSGGSTANTNVRWDLFNPPSAVFESANQSGSAGLYSATLTAPATPGTWYYQARALVNGVEAESGVAVVNVTSSGPPPANDDFPGATLSGGSVVTTGTNVGSTSQAGEPDPDGFSGPSSVWWSWTAPSTGLVVISTAGSDFDTTLGVYTGAVVNALTFVAENDDASLADMTSAVTFTATAGVEYRIQVNGFLGETGNIVLSIAPPAPAPSGGGGGGGRCGLMGIDVLVVLALLHGRRRTSRG